MSETTDEAAAQAGIEITAAMIDAGIAAYFEATQGVEYTYDRVDTEPVGRLVRMIIEAVEACRPGAMPQPLPIAVEPPADSGAPSTGTSIFGSVPSGKGPAWGFSPVVDALLKKATARKRVLGLDAEWRALGIKLFYSRRDGSARLMLPMVPALWLGDSSINTRALFIERREQGARRESQRLWKEKQMCVVLPLDPPPPVKARARAVETTLVAPARSLIRKRKRKRTPDYWVT